MRVCEMADEPSDPRAFYLRTRDDLDATKAQGNKRDGDDANETGRADVMDSEVRGCVTRPRRCPRHHRRRLHLARIARSCQFNSRTQPRFV